MLRRTIVLSITLAILCASLVGEAHAGETENCYWDSHYEDIVCYAQNGEMISIGGRPVDRGGVWPPPGWTLNPRIIYQPDGTGCVTMVYEPPSGPVRPEDVNPYDGGTRDPGSYPPCPAEPGTPESREPAVIARRYWEQIPLPRPKPYIAPGWAITGKLAYLETNSQTRYTYTNSTIVGPLVIEATGRYYVKWGDDEQSGPFSYEGKPWPDGQITHDYVWAKSYDIVVEEHWTATWSLGGKSGTLRELITTGRIDNFPARQIQAVVRVLPS